MNASNPLSALVKTAMTTAFVAMALFTTAVTLPASAFAGEPESKDQIVASFERDFQREAPDAAPATGKSIDDDVIYELLNSIHWSPGINPVTTLAKNEAGPQTGPCVGSGTAGAVIAPR